MTTARTSQVNIDTTPFYHCMVRCVRRAFLCGQDPVEGRNLDHRKNWVLERLHVLAQAFAIDICAYAVMSNHIHLVLHIDRSKALNWNAEEVRRRARMLFPRIFSGDSVSDSSTSGVAGGCNADKISQWRERLTDLSWFMRCLNEFIARKANKEDRCTGRFWEGRFRSQALLDDGALLACMSYVDLNPVRAGVANTLRGSGWTSIQQRLRQALAQEGETLSEAASHTATGEASRPHRSHRARLVRASPSPTSGANHEATASPEVVEQQAGVSESVKAADLSVGVTLASMRDKRNIWSECSLAAADTTALHQEFRGQQIGHAESVLPLCLADYVELLEWTGGQIRPGKRGRLKTLDPPQQLLLRCGLAPAAWLNALQRLGGFAALVGSPHSLQQAAPVFKRRWAKGAAQARSMYL